MEGSKILFLGVAYKPNIDDARESPALQIIDLIIIKGGEVYYHDPYIPTIKTTEDNLFNSVELIHETLQNAGCVVFTTNHEEVNIEMINEQARLIVDLRNVIKNASDKVCIL